MSLGPTHYRYYSSLGQNGVELHCERFTVVGETPRCYYVAPEWMQGYSEDFVKTYRRRVLKDSHKRYCYPDRSEALQSFISRQQWRESHAKKALSQATLAGAKARELLDAIPTDDTDINCGHDAYTSNLRWIEL